MINYVFYLPVFWVAPSSVSYADSFPPRGSLRAMLRWGDCYDIFLHKPCGVSLLSKTLSVTFGHYRHDFPQRPHWLPLGGKLAPKASDEGAMWRVGG